MFHITMKPRISQIEDFSNVLGIFINYYTLQLAFQEHVNSNIRKKKQPQRRTLNIILIQALRTSENMTLNRIIT